MTHCNNWSIFIAVAAKPFPTFFPRPWRHLWTTTEPFSKPPMDTPISTLTSFLSNFFPIFDTIIHARFRTWKIVAYYVFQHGIIFNELEIFSAWNVEKVVVEIFVCLKNISTQLTMSLRSEWIKWLKCVT